MDTELKIDDPETLALVSELAELMGADVEQAVTRAVRDRLVREREVKRRVEEIRAAAAALRAQMGSPLPSSDHSWLYGEDGLPA